MKKYIYAIPSIIMIMYLGFMAVYLLSGFNISDKNVLFVSIIAFIPFIIYVYQIIRCVKDAIKDKMYAWIVLLVLCGFIFVPYYGVKYEQDRILLRNSIITYAISAFFLLSVTILYALTLIGKHDYIIVTTRDGNAEFKLSKDWKEKNTEYSAYASNKDKDIAFAVLTYDLSEYETYTVDNILEDQKRYFDNKLGVILEQVSEPTVDELSDKTIKTVEYFAKLEDGNKIYRLSTISFSNSSYVLYTFSAVLEKDYNKVKDELSNINKSAKKR